MQLLDTWGYAVLKAFITYFVSSNLNRLPSLGSRPGVAFGLEDAAKCCAPPPKAENKGEKKITCSKSACAKAGRYSTVLSIKAVSTAWGYFFNCLSAIQQCSDGDAPAPGPPRDTQCHPQVAQRGFSVDRSMGWGCATISYLTSLCSISEIGSVLLLAFPSTHAPHPPGIRLSFDPMLK